jgi:hypothetical protein
MRYQLPDVPLRRLSVLAVLAAALFVLPSAARAAQAPRVEIGVGKNVITVTTADDPGRGAVRLQVAGDEPSEPRTVAIIQRKRGVSRPDVDAARDDGDPAERFGRVAGSVSLGTADRVAVDVRAGRYLLPSLYDPLTEILRGLFAVAGLR